MKLVKKRIWVFPVILIIVILGLYIRFAQSPKIFGNTVSYVNILTPQGKPILEWTAIEDKPAIKTLSKALSNMQTPTPVNEAPADYWFHIGVKNSSNPIDVLVWLPGNQAASFVFAFREPDGSMGFGGVQSSYPISDKIRDKLLQLLKK